MWPLPLHEAGAGVAAGFVGTLLGFPLDALKTRRQAGAAGVTLASVARAEGVGALYRGVGAPLVSLTVLNALNFSAFAAFRERVGASASLPAAAADAVAGAAVGPLSAAVSTPFELVKVQLQSRGAAGDNGLAASFRYGAGLARRHGLGALYVGGGVNSVRESLFLAVYFSSYCRLKPESTEGAQAQVAAAGASAGALAWVVSYPLDAVKGRIQSRRLNEPALSAKHAARDLLAAHGGLKGLYVGVGPSVMRAVLVSGSRFSAYEAALRALAGGEA